MALAAQSLTTELTQDDYAVLRAISQNSPLQPISPNQATDKLTEGGYITKLASGTWKLTDKGIRLLISYRRVKAR
jgi:Mn-dependent DtxR family transcriptional regulator